MFNDAVIIRRRSYMKLIRNGMWSIADVILPREKRILGGKHAAMHPSSPKILQERPEIENQVYEVFKECSWLYKNG